jgi:hypothetical protein
VREYGEAGAGTGMGGGNMTCCCDVTRKEEGRELPGESERKGWREHERVTEVEILH